MLLTWTLPLSALLMLLEHPLWPYLGLVGGGVFLVITTVTRDAMGTNVDWSLRNPLVGWRAVD